MARTPKNLAEFLQSDKIEDQAMSVIDAYWDKFKFNRTLNVQSGEKLRPEDQKQIIIGLAMRMTDKEILKMVNEMRNKAGLINVERNNLQYYRVKYADLIDEVYLHVATRIGEIYSTADKVIRIARLHELAERFREYVVENIDNTGEINKETNQAANTYLRVLSAMNIEMGGSGLVRRALKPREQEPDAPLTKSDVEQLMLDKYKDQLPDMVPVKTENVEVNDTTVHETTHS